MGALLRSNPTISAVICYNDIIAMGAWFGLLRAGRQSGEGGVETFFDQQVALGAFADVGENALDDLPIVWATTPAREMGYTLADRMMQRIEKSDVQAGHQIVSARLVTTK
ncbi:Maltose regulon regulatory protein MalI [compost metagenome]